MKPIDDPKFWDRKYAEAEGVMSSSGVDITGTMQKPKADWQARVEELCTPLNFDAHIRCFFNVSVKLSEDEHKRLYKKLDLVREWAIYMAMGMLKGTLKYEEEANLEQLVSHVVGEGADQACYEMLMFDAWRKQNDG